MVLRLSTAQSDRAAGVLLGLACGDALGAPYEFGPPLGEEVEVAMKGGGTFGWAPGEWTDDTSMAVAIAEVAAEGLDLRSVEAQDRIAGRWAAWAETAKDVGIQTRQVLRSATQVVGTQPTADGLRDAAAELHRRTGRTAGNGSLMRTAPVALAYLHDKAALVEAANGLSALTHADPEAGEACALWCLAIRTAVLDGTFDGLQQGLEHLPADRRSVWAKRLREAESRPPADFEHNGWVVEALQGAWSAISRTPVPTVTAGQPADHLRLALEATVRGGRDTDTVAAIAGALLGARWGASAVPSAWRRRLHGWPGVRARDLVRLAILSAQGGLPDRAGWPSRAAVDYSRWPGRRALVRHPHDAQVWLSGVGALDQLPDGVDAVVSLCRLGADEVPARGVEPNDHVEVWLVDDIHADKNPNLAFVLHDAAAAVAALRDEGRTVLLHCVQAQSRTPTVAALYGARVSGKTPLEALADVRRVLPDAVPNPTLLAVLQALS